MLERHYAKVTTLTSPKLLDTALRGEAVDAVLLDMNFTAGVNNGNEGIYWLRRIRDIRPDVKVVLFTAYADVDLAVRSMRDGAVDFVVKPWDNERLVASLRNACELARSQREVKLLREIRRELTVDEPMFWGTSPAMERIREIIAMGTGCVEIKSGYGLTTEDELKMLRVIRRIRETSPITVRATFLGAHAVGRAYKGRQQEYVDLICREMIPAVGREKLAEFVDVFCDQGFFTVEETEQILRAGAEYGLVPKIHANELAVSGGVQVGVRNKALSVDHLERMGAEEIEVLRTSGTMPTMLPGAAFFLEMPYPPARAMIEGGLSVALASDFNPGSSPSGSMKMIVSLACIKMRMTPAEAINAATLNGAYAMGLSSEYGSITVGKKANFFLTTKIPSVAYLPYAYTSLLIHRVFLRGQEVK